MASPIGSVYVNLGVNSAEFKTGMKSAQASAKAFGKEMQTASRMASANARNLSFQLVDMAQTIPLALQSPIHGIQGLGFQMAQIGQIYAGNGGMKQALKDSIGQVAGFARAAGPAVAAAAAIAAALAGMTYEINQASDVTVSFGDTFMATMQVAGRAIYEFIQPAAQAIAPWFATAWEAVVADVKLSGNQIINAVRVAVEGVKTAVSAVPGIFSAAWNGAAAAVYSAMQDIVLSVDRMLSAVTSGFNDVFGTSFAPPSALLDAWDDLNVRQGNAAAASKKAAAEVTAAWEGFRAKAEEIAASDPMGAIFGAVSGQARANALARQAPEGGGAGAGGSATRDANLGRKTLSDFADGASAVDDAFSDARDTVGGFFSDFRQGLQNGEGIWRSFANAATTALDRIVDKLMNDVLDAIFQVNNAGAGGSGGGFLGKLLGIGVSAIGGVSGFNGTGTVGPGTGGLYAKGGAIPSGGWGIVGEAGPEIVTGPARVFSNADSRRMMSGGGTVLNFTSNIDARGSTMTAGEFRGIARQEAQRSIAALQNARRDDPGVLA